MYIISYMITNNSHCKKSPLVLGSVCCKCVWAGKGQRLELRQMHFNTPVNMGGLTWFDDSLAERDVSVRTCFSVQQTTRGVFSWLIVLINCKHNGVCCQQPFVHQQLISFKAGVSCGGLDNQQSCVFSYSPNSEIFVDSLSQTSPTLSLSSVRAFLNISKGKYGWTSMLGRLPVSGGAQSVL